MTKEAYFKMMEELQSEPVDSEIPIELQDFAPEIQQIMELYAALSDRISDSTGIYMGKLLEGLPFLLQVFCFALDTQYVLEILAHIEAENVNLAVKKHNSKNKVELKR
jgi:hypothetical protein